MWDGTREACRTGPALGGGGPLHRTAMNCPFCGHSESKVIDSRESPEGIRRRRECERCSLRFTTYERVHSMPLLIVKRDGRREPFSSEKLERSLRLACAKRPLEISAISKMVVDIENELQKLGKAEVESRVVGEMVIERLRRLDRVAYIRFASVYRDFQDIDTFAREVEALRREAEGGGDPGGQLELIPDGVPRQTGRLRRARGPSRSSGREGGPQRARPGARRRS